jgi:hypothetical protein
MKVCLPKLQAGIALGIALAVTSVALPVRADVSSWLYVGAGPSALRDESRDWEVQPSLQLETGLGSSPAARWIVGGVFRTHTHFGQGTDIALLVRTASHGFVNGDWGAAFDVGPQLRWWGSDSTGIAGSLVMGAPWGITANLGGSYGGRDAVALSATLGIDLARLTIYRTTGSSWWKNPFPAYRPEER